MKDKYDCEVKIGDWVEYVLDNNLTGQETYFGKIVGIQEAEYKQNTTNYPYVLVCRYLTGTHIWCHSTAVWKLSRNEILLNLMEY